MRGCGDEEMFLSERRLAAVGAAIAAPGLKRQVIRFDTETGIAAKAAATTLQPEQRIHANEANLSIAMPHLRPRACIRWLRGD